MPPVIFHRLVPALLSIVRFGVGLLFFQHRAEKLWGFAGARTVGVHLSLIGMAGPIDGAGGILIGLRLFTRAAAFILCGEMAVAYFTWVRFGFWPINNGGEDAAIFGFLFLWLFTAGPGPWSLDSVIAPLRARPLPARVAEAVSSWEDYARAVLPNCSRVQYLFAWNTPPFWRISSAWRQKRRAYSLGCAPACIWCSGNCRRVSAHCWPVYQLHCPAAVRGAVYRRFLCGGSPVGLADPQWR